MDPEGGGDQEDGGDPDVAAAALDVAHDADVDAGLLGEGVLSEIEIPTEPAYAATEGLKMLTGDLASGLAVGIHRTIDAMDPVRPVTGRMFPADIPSVTDNIGDVQPASASLAGGGATLSPDGQHEWIDGAWRAVQVEADLLPLDSVSPPKGTTWEPVSGSFIGEVRADGAWWAGTEWKGGSDVPVLTAPATILSPDGRQQWNGSAWVAVESEAVPPATTGVSASMGRVSALLRGLWSKGPKVRVAVVLVPLALIIGGSVAVGAATSGGADEQVSGDGGNSFNSDEGTAVRYCGIASIDDVSHLRNYQNATVSVSSLLPDAAPSATSYVYTVAGTSNRLVWTYNDTGRIVVGCPNGSIGYAS